MDSRKVRGTYLKFFEDKGHKIISPSPLVLVNDPTTLFTSSGMQQLVKNLMGEPHPNGRRLVDSQPCLRAHGLSDDISKVGNNRNTTFFEMLGNWSLGDYFKKEQISWFWEFLTKELNLNPEKLHVTIFEGEAGVPKDEETYQIWKQVGVPEERIHFYKENWWSRAGGPDQMPIGEIGGPDSEVFFESDIEHDPSFGEKCGPECECGKFLEVGNSVFMQYKKTENGLEELPNKNVDFGGGLERLTAATINNSDIFMTDIFQRIVKAVEKLTGKSYQDPENQKHIRVIADHIKASVFIIKEGVVPGNKEQGYVLRKLIRRMSLKVRTLKGQLTSVGELEPLITAVKETYAGVYLDDVDFKMVNEVVEEEVSRFSKNLEKGLREIEKINEINAKVAFDLYQSLGFPLEITQELFEQKGQVIDKNELKKEFEEHQKLSRLQSSKMFKESLGVHN